MASLPLVIYHDKCVDGMAAAWCAWKYFKGEVSLTPANYGQLPPDVLGRQVYILDFSYPRDTLSLLRDFAQGIIVIDHHKTAAEDLAPFAAPAELNITDYIPTPKGLTSLFDMERSGAGMAWDFFFPDQPRPMLIDHIEDRDLWKFKDPDTRAVHAALASYELNLETMDALVRLCEAGRIDHLIAEGQAIDRRHMQMVRDNIEATVRRMNLGGYNVPVCNAPYALASDTGNILCKGEPFAATYIDTSTGRQFSLRSTNEGADASEVAKKYGGGGHRNACGFTAKRGWEGEDE